MFQNDKSKTALNAILGTWGIVARLVKKPEVKGIGARTVDIGLAMNQGQIPVQEMVEVAKLWFKGVFPYHCVIENGETKVRAGMSADTGISAFIQVGNLPPGSPVSDTQKGRLMQFFTTLGAIVDCKDQFNDEVELAQRLLNCPTIVEIDGMVYAGMAEYCRQRMDWLLEQKMVNRGSRMANHIDFMRRLTNDGFNMEGTANFSGLSVFNAALFLDDIIREFKDDQHRQQYRELGEDVSRILDTDWLVDPNVLANMKFKTGVYTPSIILTALKARVLLLENRTVPKDMVDRLLKTREYVHLRTREYVHLSVYKDEDLAQGRLLAGIRARQYYEQALSGVNEGLLVGKHRTIAESLDAHIRQAIKLSGGTLAPMSVFVMEIAFRDLIVEATIAAAFSQHFRDHMVGAAVSMVGNELAKDRIHRILDANWSYRFTGTAESGAMFGLTRPEDIATLLESRIALHEGKLTTEQAKAVLAIEFPKTQLEPASSRLGRQSVGRTMQMHYHRDRDRCGSAALRLGHDHELSKLYVRLVQAERGIDTLNFMSDGRTRVLARPSVSVMALTYYDLYVMLIKALKDRQPQEPTKDRVKAPSWSEYYTEATRLVNEMMEMAKKDPDPTRSAALSQDLTAVKSGLWAADYTYHKPKPKVTIGIDFTGGGKLMVFNHKHH